MNRLFKYSFENYSIYQFVNNFSELLILFQINILDIFDKVDFS